jgi:hypothetical protein
MVCSDASKLISKCISEQNRKQNLSLGESEQGSGVLTMWSRACVMNRSSWLTAKFSSRPMANAMFSDGTVTQVALGFGELGLRIKDLILHLCKNIFKN